MPFVLKNKNNSQIFTSMLKNAYGLSYYGPIYWNEQSEAESQFKESLQQLGVPDGQLDQWELWAVDEKQIRIFNVKLNNNPRKQLFVDDAGKSFTE